MEIHRAIEPAFVSGMYMYNEMQRMPNSCIQFDDREQYSQMNAQICHRYGLVWAREWASAN